MEVLDCREHRCPHPVVETRKKLLAGPNKPLQVLVGDETARENVSRLAKSQGYEITVSATGGGFALDLTPGKGVAERTAPAAATGKTVIFVGSDEMGSGDAELGRVLMKNFLFTLLETDTTPDTIYFVNAGVKLTSEGSEMLEALDKLACMGVDIASCGLCLEYYGLKEKLAAGRSTNMLEIAETLQSAGRVIRP